MLRDTTCVGADISATRFGNSRTLVSFSYSVTFIVFVRVSKTEV